MIAIKKKKKNSQTPNIDAREETQGMKNKTKSNARVVNRNWRMEENRNQTYTPNTYSKVSKRQFHENANEVVGREARTSAENAW